MLLARLSPLFAVGFVVSACGGKTVDETGACHGDTPCDAGVMADSGLATPNDPDLPPYGPSEPYGPSDPYGPYGPTCDPYYPPPYGCDPYGQACDPYDPGYPYGCDAYSLGGAQVRSGARGFTHVFAAPATSNAIEVSAPLRWHDAPGRPSALDFELAVQGGEQPLLQLFSAGARPFARVGLRVVPLDADVSYVLEVARDARFIRARLVRESSGEEVLTSSQAVAVEGDATVRFTLPATAFRSTVEISAP